MGNWYTRPVVRIRDTARALEFYSAMLGFKEDWRHVEEGVFIVQVSRQGCELILSDQWPQEAGREVLFISLDEPDFQAMSSEFAERAVDTKAGQWGYQLLVVEDPDGNRLWFPHPSPTAPRADRPCTHRDSDGLTSSRSQLLKMGGKRPRANVSSVHAEARGPG